MYNPYNTFEYSELESLAYSDDNLLALEICNRAPEIVEKELRRMEAAKEDYNFGVYESASTVQYLMGEGQDNWYRDTSIKDKVFYRLKGFEADTHPYRNNIILFRNNGSDRWTLEAQCGEYGEEKEWEKFIASGPVQAQKQATILLVEWVKRGNELHVC